MPSGKHDRTSQLADLAHFVLSVARDIRIYGDLDPEIIEITLLESLVMTHIEQCPGIRPTRICSETALRSSNTSAVLRALEAKDMIQRVPDPRDRRSVGIYATPLAASNLAKVRVEWARLLVPHVDDATDLAPAIELLKALDASLIRRGNPALSRSGQ